MSIEPCHIVPSLVLSPRNEMVALNHKGTGGERRLTFLLDENMVIAACHVTPPDCNSVKNYHWQVGLRWLCTLRTRYLVTVDIECLATDLYDISRRSTMN